MSDIYKDYYELKKKYDDIQNILGDCLSIIYCMGGPLNDNILKYSNKQLVPFSKISTIIKFVKD